jgi:hypothetical protein
VLQVVAVLAFRRHAAGRPFGVAVHEGLELGVRDLRAVDGEGGERDGVGRHFGQEESRCVVWKRWQRPSMAVLSVPMTKVPPVTLTIPWTLRFPCPTPAEARAEGKSASSTNAGRIVSLMDL